MKTNTKMDKINRIKVNEITFYNITKQPINTSNQVYVPVIKGELILIDSTKEDSTIWQLDKGGKFGRYVKPVIVLSTEELKIGDSYIVALFNSGNVPLGVHIEKVHSISGEWINNEFDSTVRHFQNCKKVIALPEHFRLMYLNGIVHGYLDHGDSVLLECTSKTAYRKDGCPFIWDGNNYSAHDEHGWETLEEKDAIRIEGPFVKLDSNGKFMIHEFYGEDSIHAHLFKKIIKAWETLTGYKNYSADEVQYWLHNDMRPIMDEVREHLLMIKQRP